MNKYCQDVVATFLAHADAQQALPMKAYMRHQFEFLGIKSALRKKISKPFLQKNVIPDFKELEAIVWMLWNEPFRELQYFSIDLMAKYKACWNDTHISFFEKLVQQQAWWDTVDGLAGQIGYIIQQNPENVALMQTWNSSDSLWKIRVSIIYQLKFGLQTNAAVLAEMIVRHQNTKEFFIQKAAGWALRQYAKYNPTWVQTFLEANQLPNLTVREAAKHLKISQN